MGRAWKDEDKELLTEMVREGRGDKEIAATLRGTVDAGIYMRHKLHLGRRVGYDYTQIDAALEAGATDKELMTRYGISRGSLYLRRKLLKSKGKLADGNYVCTAIPTIPIEERLRRAIKAKAANLGVPESFITDVWLKGPEGPKFLMNYVV
jgi:hypothetical protein